MATNVMELTSNAIGNEKDTLFLLGGVAMMVFGAGLILSNPVIRRYLSQFGVGNLVQSVMPDVERYFRLRAM